MHAERQTGRQTDRQTDRHIDSKAEEHIQILYMGIPIIETKIVIIKVYCIIIVKSIMIIYSIKTLLRFS